MPLATGPTPAGSMIAGLLYFDGVDGEGVTG